MSQPEPLQAAYDFSSAPESVKLFSGELTLSWRDGSHSSTAEVFLKFIPESQISIESEVSGLPVGPLNLLLNHRPGISYSLDGQEIQGFVKEFDFNFEDHARLSIRPSTEPFQVLGDKQSKTSVTAIFHLFNFPDFRGGQHQKAALAGCALLVLQSEEWQVSVQALPNNATREVWKRIKNEGGCFLTHVVQLERKDGKLFSEEDASEQCHILNNFLSFINGGRCAPVCGVGLDAEGAVTWKTFSSPYAVRPPYSWFNPFEASQAEILFPLFAKRWQQSEEWKNCLHSAIYWYLQANTRGGSPGIDAAIILAQAALERLAHHHLVVDRKMISPEGLDRLKASDRLRLLFSCLNIPVEICASTPEIQKAAPSFKWLDAPHAITDIRNELIHPASKKKVHDCYVDAWKLSLWYLELSLLAMCGYDYTYTNRLTARYVTDSEPVPWGKRA